MLLFQSKLEFKLIVKIRLMVQTDKQVCLQNQFYLNSCSPYPCISYPCNAYQEMVERPTRPNNYTILVTGVTENIDWYGTIKNTFQTCP